MAKRQSARQSARQQSQNDQMVDMVIDEVEEMPPEALTELQAVEAWETTQEAAEADSSSLALASVERVDPNVQDEDAEAIAAIVVSPVVSQEAQTIVSSVASAERYLIGLHAGKIMKRQGVGVAACAVIIGQTLQRRAEVTGRPVPRVWKDLVSLDHALKCWIPGTVESSELPAMWKTTRPFHRLPGYVVNHIKLGSPGFDHGGMVCDYWSRIHPSRLTTLIVEDFLALTDRVSRRDYLRELLAPGGEA